VLTVYLAFAAVAGLVGILLFYTKVYYLAATSVFTFIACIVIFFINRIQPNLERQVDWSFDQTMCELGEKVRITATNLCPKHAVIFPKGKPVWVVRKEGGTEVVHSEPNPEGIVIAAGNNFSWEVSTDKQLKEPGIYRVFPAKVIEKNVEEGLWSEPLRRAIIVSPRRSPQPEPKPAETTGRTRPEDKSKVSENVGSVALKEENDT
jgi:hypothetical protein